MTPLPKSEWRVKRCGPDHAIVGMHTNGGGIYWTKFALADLPNEFIGVEDLKSLTAHEWFLGDKEFGEYKSASGGAGAGDPRAA
jgi:hypothetical protein